MSHSASHINRESEIRELQGKISELERKMEVYRKSEERYRAILEGIEDGYYEVDLEGNTTFFNEPYLTILGYSADEMRRKNYTEYVTRETAMLIFETFNHVYKTGEPTKALDWQLIRKDGTRRFVEISVSLILDVQGHPTGFRGIMRDITSRVMEQEELRQAKIKAEEANVAKSEFLANISHEIRTPLNAVIGFSEILCETLLNEQQKEFTDTIRKNGDLLLGLINDILDFARIESNHYTHHRAIDFDPELMVYDVFEKIKPKILGKPIEMLCRIDDNLPALVNGDPVRLRQILTSLVSNASKFTTQGEIELSVDVTDINTEKVGLHIRVRDTGIGINTEQLAIMFEPFRQIDGSSTRKYSGTGLGLAMCKKLIEQMGGHVNVESTFGSTTTFHVMLSFPLSRAPSRVKPRFGCLSGKNVLVVDDNASNLIIMTYMLEKKGLTVVTVLDSTQTLASIREAEEKGKPFDLGIIDIQMPGLNGYEVASAIRSREHAESRVSFLPLLALSSMVEKDAHNCYTAGFDGFLKKPANRSKLYQMLEALLGKSNKPQDQEDSPNDAILTQYSIREKLKHSLRILYAEDNVVNQKITTTLLTKAGYQVDIAVNGREAVDRFSEDPFRYDLILMDIQMPVLDGLEATQILREKGFDAIPIVAVTANAMKGDREKCLAAGMNDYMTKPVRRDNIFEIIDKWCFKSKDL